MTGRVQGAFLEKAFKKQAQSLGLFAKKNPLSCAFAGKRLRLVPGQLDFILIAPGGKVSFLDCKSMGKDFFRYSEIDENQLSQAVKFNEWGVPSGFLVWFRKRDRVVYYTGRLISDLGKRSRLIPEVGVNLGSIMRFDLSRVFSTELRKDPFDPGYA